VSPNRAATAARRKPRQSSVLIRGDRTLCRDERRAAGFLTTLPVGANPKPAGAHRSLGSASTVSIAKDQLLAGRHVPAFLAGCPLLPCGRGSRCSLIQVGRLRTCPKIRFASRPRPRPSSSSSKYPAKPRTKDEGRGRARGNHTFFRHTLSAGRASPRKKRKGGQNEIQQLRWEALYEVRGSTSLKPLPAQVSQRAGRGPAPAAVTRTTASIGTGGEDLSADLSALSRNRSITVPGPLLQRRKLA
jgi:hypothetical protein